MNSQVTLAMAATALLLTTACSRQQESTPTAVAEPTAAIPESALPAPTAAPQSVSHTGNKGTVLAVTDAGTYTYIQVDADGQTLWLATNTVSVSEGDRIAWGTHAVMRDFHSKMLNRTFETVLFVNGITSAETTPPSAMQGTVISVTNASGYSYIEVGTPENSQWLAAPQTSLERGDTIAWQRGSNMQNFSSKSLGRTFENILFVASIEKTN